MCKPESVTSVIILEKKMLEWAIADWTSMPTMGVTYSKQVQKDVRLCYFMFTSDVYNLLWQP